MNVRRLTCAVGAPLAVLLAAIAAISPAGAIADSCPNAALRIDAPSANLPDCRAYEMVSPLEKGPASDVIDYANVAVKGGRVAYTTVLPLPQAQGAPILSENLATRKAGGWSSVSINTAIGNFYPTSLVYQLGDGKCLGFTPELTQCAVYSHTALVPGAPEGSAFESDYIESFGEGENRSFTLLTPPNISAEDAPVATTGMWTTPDMSHVVISARGSLTSATEGKEQLRTYDWSDGELHDIGYFPESMGGGVMPNVGGGEHSGDIVPGSRQSRFSRNAVSEDGRRIFFTYAERQLWMREDDRRTVEVSASQRSEPTRERPAEFVAATSDGSKVWFLSGQKLTNDSTALGRDLYEYNVATGVLTDRTVDHNPADPAGAVVLGLADYTNDGSFLYFVAVGQLDGEQGEPNAPNMYVLHEGKIRYVATLSSAISEGAFSDEPVWEEDAEGTNAVVMSADGKQLAFLSHASLAGANNAGHQEVYLYNADTAHILCVSCDPGGGASTSDADFGEKNFLENERPPWNMPEEGHRVVFDTGDPLVPSRDVNGQVDVYEWRESGMEGCQEENGCVSLLSGGMGDEESRYVGADASGANVLFLTREQLVSQDSDTRVDLYDARVGGGFPAVPSAPEPCRDEACRPLPTPAPSLLTPGSIAFDGPGNVTPATRAVKQLKRKRAKRRHGRHKHVKRSKATRKTRKAKRSARSGRVQGRAN